jgi:hypothetical protein
MRATQRWLLGLLVVALGGCRSPREQPVASAADSLGRYDLNLPARWAGHYAVDSLSTAERGRARPGALVFLYQPSDTAQRREVLLVVAVYDSAVWRTIRSEEGPPPGDSVAARAGRVYVLAFPQSNPFTPNTPDAILFDLLLLRTTELPSIVQLR